MSTLEDETIETLIGIANAYTGRGARSEEEIILAIQKLSRYTHREDVVKTLLQISKSKYGRGSFSENIILAAMRALP